MQHFSLKLTSLLLATLMLIPAASAAPPSNDDQANAELLTVLGATADTREATTDGPTFTCTFVGKDVWYTVIGTPDMVIDTIGSNFDTTLALFDASGNMVACNDDTVGLQSMLTVPDAGIYTLQAGGYAGWGVASGDLVVNVGL